MLGVKGMDFLDAVWTIASNRGCECKTDSHFAQDMLGAVRCDICKRTLITQIEVNEMEIDGTIPKPNISNAKLNNWYANK